MHYMQKNTVGVNFLSQRIIVSSYKKADIKKTVKKPTSDTTLMDIDVVDNP